MPETRFARNATVKRQCRAVQNPHTPSEARCAFLITVLPAPQEYSRNSNLCGDTQCVSTGRQACGFPEKRFGRMVNNGIQWTPELEKELYTATEIEQNNLQAALLCALVDARQKKGISQRKLGSLCGISQTSIARIESGAMNNPTLETLFKLLTPLGMTIKIVPLNPPHR